MKVKPTRKKGSVVVEMDQPGTQMLAQSGQVFQLKSVLVPVDFSPCSHKAVHYATAFGRQFGVSLILLHVIHINYSGIEFGMIDVPALEVEAAEGARKELERLAEEPVRSGVPCEVVVKTGPVVGEITDTARERRVDLIIVSTHGHTGLKHALLGSIAENVVRHAPCPVLTVREHEREFVPD